MTTYDPPSDKQMAFLDSLVIQLADLRKAIEGDTFDRERYIGLGQAKSAEFDKRQVSNAIDQMKAKLATYRTTYPEAVPARAEAEPGYYVRNGQVFVVVENKAKTRTYAKRLVIFTDAGGAKRGRWEYAKGVGGNLARAGITPLTVEEAARLGHLHGFCVICGKPLTDPESVERGIGPVCVKRLSRKVVTA